MSAGVYLLHGIGIRAEGELATRLADEILAPCRTALDVAPAITLSAACASSRALEALPPPRGTPVCLDPGLRVHARSDGAVEIRSSRAAVAVQPGGHVAVTLAEEAARRPALFAALEGLLALALALRPLGLHHLHGAGIALPAGRIALVLGFSGHGKTTLALAALAAGGACAGDDTLFLAERGSAIGILGLPRPFHLSDRTAEAFPALDAHLGERRGPGDKRRLDAAAAFPGQWRNELAAPDALLSPVIADVEQTRLEPSIDAEGLAALLAASFFAPIRGPGLDEQLRIYREVADRASTYRVLLGRDLLTDPRSAIARIEAALVT